MSAKGTKQIYWHQELPALDAEAIGEHVIEATSRRVPGTLAHRDELWHECYKDLMERACHRIAQKVHRQGGTCAHVLEESVETKHDGATGEAWLRGSFRCVVYRQPNRVKKVRQPVESTCISGVESQLLNSRIPAIVTKFMPSRGRF